jgi:hypothetical protein
MGEAKRRKDNPELARRLADADRDRALRGDPGIPQSTCEYDEHGTLGGEFPPGALVSLEIGQRGNLNNRMAVEAAAATFRNIAKRTSPGLIYVFLVGYDQDPRELWDIPEVAEYVRLWARLAELDLESATTILESHAVSFLAACGCFGEEAKRAVNCPPPITEQ